MRIKIPRKKNRLTVFTALLLVVLLAISPNLSASGETGSIDSALFWSVQKEGQTVGYLLGTIHSEDPRVLDFSEDFLSHLQASEIFAMELVPDITTLTRLNTYMHYPEGESLEEVIGGDRFEALAAAMATYQVPEELIRKMKPWAAMMTLSTPPPVTGFFMDLSLSLRASGKGLKVIGLETLEQQLSFLKDMPMDMQMSLLDQAIAEFEKVGEVHEEMVNAYLKGDLQDLQAMSLEQLDEIGKTASDYFTRLGIDERNHRMLQTLMEYLPENNVFVAVGALHLPGKEGLICLLRQQGFELEPMAMPFVSDSSGTGK